MIIASIVIYLIVMLILGGVAFRRGEQTTEDYFLAGRGLGTAALVVTMFATWMSTFAFLGSPGFYFSRGLAWYIAHGLLVVASPLLLLMVGRRMALLGKESGAITPGDLLGWWFRSRLVAATIGVICLLALIPYATIQILGIAKVFEVGTHGAVPYYITVLGTAAIIAAYAMLGGVRAIIWTDAIQAVLFAAVMIIGGCTICYVAVSRGISLTDALGAHPTGFRLDSSDGGGVLTLAMIWTFGYILLPHMWQRMLMARDADVLNRTVPWSSCLALLVIVVPSLLIGLLGPAVLGSVADSDKVVPTLWKNHLDSIFWMLMLAAFAAGMSTMDSQMLTAASVVQRDLLGIRAARPHPWLLRSTVAILTLSFAGLALTPQVSSNIIVLASKGIGIAFLLGPPALFLVLGWRCHSLAVVAGLSSGLMVVLLGDVFGVVPSLPLGFGYPLAAASVVLVFMLAGSQTRYGAKD